MKEEIKAFLYICTTQRDGEIFSYRYRLSKSGDMDFQYSVTLEHFVRFQVLPPSQPGGSETNRISKQP